MISNTYIGKNQYVYNGSEIADEFLRIAKEDEKAADFLYQNQFYNQAIYFYIQSMEKFIKAYICRRIDVSNEYFAEQLRSLGHSLDAAADFFVKIIAGNDENLHNQLNHQIKTSIFENIRFTSTYNAVRYPYYNSKYHSYCLRKTDFNDCERIQEMYRKLKDYIEKLYIAF